MEGIITDIAKNEGQSLVNFLKNEAQYLCCFSSYAATFDQKKKALKAKQLDVKGKIEEARGVSRVTNEAREWTETAKSLIDFDTGKEKCFNDLCLNCWRQYQKGKDLAEKTQQIDKLLERSTFDLVAGPANNPGIKYHSVHNFMHFGSRESTFQDLKKALEDENCNMVGLHGFGGTGKTSMAIQAGAELEGSKKFDQAIFLVVSKPPDFIKIRRDLGKQLGLTLEEGKEEELSKKIWCKIISMKEKLLVILDDVWDDLDLIKDLGIPSSHQHKACNVLITTRNLHVCESMGCLKKIQIHTLNDEDALNLFLTHGSINDSSRGLRGVAEKLVKRCGGVPVAIVAIARALRNKPRFVWENALKTLEYHDVSQGLTEAYKCLKLSYDNLKNDKAKEMFLISSLFPEDYEIPIQFLSKIAIALGLFGEVDMYHSVKSKALEAIIDLIDSSLFLTADEERVKIHDLVREVALWIREKDIQWIMDLKTPIKENIKYLSWKNDGFPNEFDGKKLEILMIFLDGSGDLKVPDKFFIEMKRLKVLLLESAERILAPTLAGSLQLLKDIRTLKLLNLELGDISFIGNLPSLESLWLMYCSIMELPKEILKLKKLRSLEVDGCKIEMNNPFEVIESCSQLEELSLVGNAFDIEKACVDVSYNSSPTTLQRYMICPFSFGLEGLLGKYGFISRWFCPGDWQNLISEATFKQFLRTAEGLKLSGGYKETRWKNLIPDIVPVEDGGMNNLIVMHLSSWPDIQCLIDYKNYGTNVTAFSKLVELELYMMDVEAFYQGSLTSGFLEQLEILRLRSCQKLINILFDGNLSLPCLKIMELIDCPKCTSVFPSFTAPSLMQLEELTIENCDSLEHIILGDDKDDKIGYESLLPKLRTLKIEGCGRLKVVLPILSGEALASLEEMRIHKCEQLSYLFDKFQQKGDHIKMMPSLKKMELSEVPSFIRIFREYHELMPLSMQRPSQPVSRIKTAAFSWPQMCCFLHKSTEEINGVICPDTVSDHKVQLGSLSSKKWFDTSEIITRQLFNVGHIKKLELAQMSSNLESLFTLPMASLILWEELTVQECDGLKHLITMEADDYNNDQMMICHSIFPKMEELKILKCKDFEFLFPSISIRLQNLKSLIVENAPELKYIVGRSHHVDHSSNQNHNVELHFDLPALETFHLQYVPKFISICAMNYYLAWPSLQDVILENHKIESFTDDLLVCSEGQLNREIIQELDAAINVMPPIGTTGCLSVQSLNNIKKMKLLNCSNLKTSLTLPMASTIMWEELEIRKCQQLKYIVEDEGDGGALMNNHRSIFPKLKELTISECDAMEYLFPAYAFQSATHLETLSIWNASELKYVFGTSHHHENQNIQTCIDCPALKTLDFNSLPKLVRICPKNYYLRGQSLQGFVLVQTPEFNVRSLTDQMVCAAGEGQHDSTPVEAMEIRWQSLKRITFCECKVEEIFNLTHARTEKNGEGHESLTSSLQCLWLRDLCELKNICVGPKYILSLNNIYRIEITGCDKLKVIFSNSAEEPTGVAGSRDINMQRIDSHH